MKAARAIAGYALAVVLLGAILSPYAFWIAHPHLPNVPFRRVFDRVLLALAVFGLWPLLRGLGMRTWGDLGFARRQDWWKSTLSGFGLGCVSFAGAGLLLVALGQRAIALPERGLVSGLISAMLAGIVVGIIEETVFRGAWQGVLQRHAPVPVAIGITSVIYSALHFLKPKTAGIGSVNWLSGFDYLGQVLTRSWSVPGVAVGFVTLLLAGCVLGLVYARTRALYLPIGIHAGWVFTLKSYALLSDAVVPRTWWGGGALIENILVWPVLLIFLGLVAWRCR